MAALRCVGGTAPENASHASVTTVCPRGAHEHRCQGACRLPARVPGRARARHRPHLSGPSPPLCRGSEPEGVQARTLRMTSLWFGTLGCLLMNLVCSSDSERVMALYLTAQLYLV